MAGPYLSWSCSMADCQLCVSMLYGTMQVHYVALLPVWRLHGCGMMEKAWVHGFLAVSMYLHVTIKCLNSFRRRKEVVQGINHHSWMMNLYRPIVIPGYPAYPVAKSLLAHSKMPLNQPFSRNLESHQSTSSVSTQPVSG